MLVKKKQNIVLSIADKSIFPAFAGGQKERNRKMKNYDKIHIIEVTHQYGCRYYAVDDLVAAAEKAGLDITHYANMDEAAEAYDGAEEVPEELAELLKDGPAVELTEWDGPYLDYIPEKDFCAETAAARYIGADLQNLIIIRNAEEAVEIAENFRGHEDIEVRRLAREIIEENRD
jgi:hypothetical protein